MSKDIIPIYAVILAGGKGVRLKPISTESKPKAFLPISKDDRTMFGMTLDRIKGLVPPENVVVVANKAHKALVKKEFPSIRKECLLLEPLSRNTAPAVAFAALNLNQSHKDAIMIVMPADHYITIESRYIHSIKCGIDFVKSHNEALVVMGLKPSYPATGFGYIKVRGNGSAAKDISKVERFVEKPDSATAKRYVKSGCYLWNSGMFIFRAGTILKNMSELAPQIYEKLISIGNAKIENIYKELPSISIDYAVMEKAKHIYCVKSDFGWQDLGNLKALKDILTKELCGLKTHPECYALTKNIPKSMRILMKLEKDINAAS